ncbi:MAG: DUF5050 domain-containing protein [Bifidobacteriaceae bacterium]|jgi:serine/threonine protein kinase|nr:DUF5050 domain-containing protein [Bifidobacteriaceae bacterium]
MSDAEEFLGAYHESLEQEVMGGAWPDAITAIYRPEACLKLSPSRQVYLVTDKRTGGRAILRVSQLDWDARIDAEYSILSRLSFPGVPKAYGTLVKDGHSYLAREYFPGEPLDQVIAKGTMSPSQIYGLTRQLCAILTYLHAQEPPVIHRDIKPQNIIMRPDGTLGLTDFGIARTFKEGSTSDTHFVGTMPYVPPEQYGYAQSSPQTDIYALGIVLIYLATGSPDRQNLAERIPDKHLRELIEHCIAFDPADRLQSADEVVKAIGSGGRNRGRLIGAVAAGALVLALAGVGIWRLADSPDGESKGPATNPGPTAVLSPSADQSPTDGESATDETASGTPSPGQSARVEGPDQAGNLAGNILNEGIAVEAGNTIYVSDGESIWQLSLDGTVLREIPTEEAECGGSTLRGLNFWDGQLYFTCDDTGIYHYDPAANRTTTLLSENVGDMYIDDGRIYFIRTADWLRLYSIGLDGFGKVRADDKLALFSAVYRGYHFFIDGDDESRVMRTDLATGETKEIYSGEPTYPTPYEGRLYIGELSIHGQGLVSVDLDGGDPQGMTDDFAIQMVPSKDGLFYLTNGYDLFRMPLEGGQPARVTPNAVGFYCVAGGWVFYENADAFDALWMVRLDGSDDHPFEPVST